MSSMFIEINLNTLNWRSRKTVLKSSDYKSINFLIQQSTFFKQYLLSIIFDPFNGRIHFYIAIFKKNHMNLHIFKNKHQNTSFNSIFVSKTRNHQSQTTTTTQLRNRPGPIPQHFSFTNFAFQNVYDKIRWDVVDILIFLCNIRCATSAKTCEFTHKSHLWRMKVLYVTRPFVSCDISTLCVSCAFCLSLI